MKIMSYVFWRVPLLIKLRPEKKVQLSGHWLECLGVPSTQIVSAGSSIKLRPEKKGTVIWPSVAMSDCFGGFVAMFFSRFLNQITNYDRKKMVQLSGLLTPFATHVTLYFYFVCT
jgi:hypothetical protein